MQLRQSDGFDDDNDPSSGLYLTRDITGHRATASDNSVWYLVNTDCEDVMTYQMPVLGMGSNNDVFFSCNDGDLQGSYGFNSDYVRSLLNGLV